MQKKQNMNIYQYWNKTKPRMILNFICWCIWINEKALQRYTLSNFISSKLKNLDGVAVALDDIIKWFGKIALKYDIYSNYQQNEMSQYKISWTEKELFDFLHTKPADPEKDEKYDEPEHYMTV